MKFKMMVSIWSKPPISSASIAVAIFEPLLKYDYLARPLQLVPNTVESLPKVEQDGKVYIFKIKPGIYFTNDPAFKGKRRELVLKTTSIQLNVF